VVVVARVVMVWCGVLVRVVVSVFVAVSAVCVKLFEIEEPAPKGKVFVKQNVNGGEGLVVVVWSLSWLRWWSGRSRSQRQRARCS
jgi:hypothetical protein